MRSEGTPHILGCLARTRTPRLYAASLQDTGMVGASVPERCPGLVCGAPLGRRDGLTPGKDSLPSDLATCAKMIATRSGGNK